MFTNKLKRYASAFIAFIICAGAVNIHAYASEDNPQTQEITPMEIITRIDQYDGTSQRITLVKSGVQVAGTTFKGDESGAVPHNLPDNMAIVQDNPGTAGYCIQPFARGIMPGGQAQTFDVVPASQLDERDKKLLGIMVAGYPNKTYGWSASDAYRATHIAMQHYIFQNPDKFPNNKNVKFNDDNWSHWANDPIIELAKTIYEAGLNNPYEPSTDSTGITITPDNDGNFTENGDNLEMTLNIDTTGSFKVGKLIVDDDIKEMVMSNSKCSITVGGRTAKFELGILGSSDYTQGIKILPTDTSVKIVLEKKAAEAYVPGGNGTKQFKYSFEAMGSSAMQAAIGRNTIQKNQDYAFLIPGEIQPVAGMLMVMAEPFEEEEKDPGKGALKILKYNKVTGQLVAGARFEIRGVSETNWDFLVQIQASSGADIPLPGGGTASTKTGVIELRDIRTGQYQITEISPPPYYDYSDLGVNSKVVTVIEGPENGNADLFPQVIFENNPFATLRIKKINEVTGAPVNGAVMRIRNALADYDVELSTMNGGVIELKNLPQGNYEISEVYAPEGYVLSSEVKTATLRWGETTEITFKNVPKTEVHVIKIDAVTGTPLDGAIFRLTNPSTGDTWEDKTYYDGYAIFTDIPAGTYILEEILAPQGYVLDRTKRTIVVENYNTYELHIKNSKVPGLTIIKMDKDTKDLLSGGVFEIEKINGENAGKITGSPFTTNMSGQVTLPGLDPASYKITEIVPPSGYNLSEPNYQIINMFPDEDNVVTFENTRMPEFSILKVDSVTGLPLGGAMFEIEKLENPGKGLLTGNPYTTDADGKIKLTGLLSGSYRVTEIKPPNGYALPDKTTHLINIRDNEDYELRVENIKLPTLTIIKVDEESKDPLQGAKFKIIRTEDETITEALTDTDGKIVLKDLQPGIYSVDEIVAPSGYLLEAQHKDIELKPGDNKELIWTNKARPKLRIQKVDANTGELLKNSEFRVSKVEDTTVSEYILENGEIILENLDEAIYRAVEFQAPEGYIIVQDTKEILTEWGKTKTLKFDNVRKPVVMFQKTNALTGKGIPGAKFKIEYEMPGGGIKTIGSFTTDATGRITIPKAEPGWYIFTETLPAPGYSMPSNPVTRQYFAPGDNAYLPSTEGFYANSRTGVYASGYAPNDGTTEQPGDSGSVTLGETGTETGMDTGTEIGTLPDTTPMSLEVHYGGEYYVEGEGFNWPLNSIVLKKADANTGKLLAGAHIELYRADEQVSGQPGTQIGRYVTDASGVVVVVGLEPGYYVAKEAQAPPNYVLAETSLQNGFLKADGTSIVEFTFRNYPFGSILITKVDGVTGKPLENARFKVTDNSGAAVGNTTGEFITNSHGEALVENIPPGSYIVTEIQAPANYAINTTPKPVEVGTDGKTYKVSFDNYPYATLVIKKLDTDTRASLDGAEFFVTTSKGDVVGTGNGYFTTDATGTITIPNLPKDSYIIKETKAPIGYVLENQTKTISIDYGNTYTQEFFNTKKSSLQIVKLDGQTKLPLKDAKFNIYKMNGELLGQYTTNSEGLIVLDELESGWYKVSEYQAPDGYLLDNTPQDVELVGNQFVKLTFENQPKASLIIKKFDASTKDALMGAKFKITKKSGDIVGEYSTNANGMIQLDMLDPGWYSAVEVAAPEGYKIFEMAQDFEITHTKTVTLEFPNQKLTSLIIKKTDDKTGAPLEGAKFYIERQNGLHVGEYTTDRDGLINLPTLTPDWYVVREIQAPDGYFLDETPKTVEVKTDTPTVITFTNKKLTALEIKKTDELSGEPLAGAKFAVEKQNGERVGEYTTDNTGLISIPTLLPDWYVVRETKAPSGYLLDETPKIVEVKTTAPTVVTFTNKKLTALEIIKVDELSNEPLNGAVFAIERQTGERVGEYTTADKGVILIPTLAPDWYIVKEIKAPQGYLLDETPKTVEVKTDTPTVVKFTNKKLTALQIKKVDEKSGKPLGGAKFAVEKQNGERVGEYTTDNTGLINIPTLAPGWYIVCETKSPDGYTLDETPKTVEVKTDVPTVVTFTNKLKSGFQIVKIDAKSGTPLPGAKFTVYKKSGEVIGEYTTDNNGVIIIDSLDNGWYKIAETKAPDGYIISESPKDIELTGNQFLRVVFENKKMTALQIKKIDGVTGNALPGAKFTIEKQNGEKIQTNENGTEFTTDGQGLINIPNLPPDYYIVRETKAPEGYVIDETPKTVQVKTDSPTIVTFSNQPLAGLKIVKVNAQTKAPIQGVEFSISKMNGEKVQNDYMGYTFTTDKTGQIYIPNLPDGIYMVTETKAADGYFIDGKPKTVEISSGKTAILKVENEPSSGLLIIKTDAQTGLPLKGVVFDVRRADGQRVAGYILDENQANTPNNSPNKTTTPNGDVSGSYTTDSNGRILINHLDSGEYHVVETKALDGYEIDTDVHSVTVTPGKQAVVKLTNVQKAGLRILKIDSVSKKGIYDVEFRVYDFDTNKEVGGPYITDNNGVVDFTGVLPEGRYKIVETRPANGYIRDDMPKTVEFNAGKVLEIIWENQPYMGQVQITKKSASDNETNGLPKGTPLASAVFEVYNYKTGNLVDQFITGSNGVGVSKPLPLGRYTVKEVSAPKYYKISDQVLDIEIEFPSQILKFEFTNEPANTGVAIKKVGPQETMPGQKIRYDFKTIQNTSTVPLSDFFFRDVIPTDAVRLDKIFTGTFNQSLKYKIMYKTNKNDYRVMADNLSSTHNNAVDASPASLGLNSDEYVTEFMFVFGNVKAGFCQVENPYIFVNVNKNLPHGFVFANKCDIGGKYGSEWIIGNSTWSVSVYNPQPGKLPRTGY